MLDDAASDRPTAAVPPTARFPWPPAEGDSIPGAFGETWKGATFDPGSFFARLPRSDGTGAALIYCLVIGVLVAGAGLFWDSSSLLTRSGTDAGTPELDPIVTFLLSPLVLLLALVFSAGISHLLLLVTGGARHGFGTSLRVFAYGYSPMIFAVVPLLGSVVGVIWMTVLTIIGLREAHETRGWKAAFAVLFPLAIILALAVVATLMLVASGAALLMR